MGVRQVTFLRWVRASCRLSDALDIALKKVERFIIFVGFELGFYFNYSKLFIPKLLGTVCSNYCRDVLRLTTRFFFENQSVF